MTNATGYHKLALQVIARGCEAKDLHFLRSDMLDFWCKVAGLDPTAVREANGLERETTED